MLTSMNSYASTDVLVRTAPPAHQAQVLWLLFQNEPADVRPARIVATLRSARQGKISMSGLLEAHRAGRLVGAAWAQVMPGRTALVWPPRLAAGEVEATAGRMLRDLDRRLEGHGVHVAQALLPVPAGPDAQRLVRHEYRHAADLIYLFSTEGQFPASRPNGSLQFRPYCQDNRNGLARLVEETYVDTLDIPLLNGARRIDDVLDGYAQTGAHDPERWLVAEKDGRSAGCLLLTDHPEHDQWELMYMGLLPWARGRGWGLQIARHAQWLTRTAGRGKLVLAVDAGNGPAIAIYAKGGFTEWDRRGAFLKVYPSSRF
jgi:ribosomal protein S18 acetylase RimI-like enzyme